MARIGIDARLVTYRAGGISQYTTHLIYELAALDRGGDYAILHSRKERGNLTAGANQHRLTCWTPPHHRFERLALGIELAMRGLDLLHSPDFIPPLGGSFKSVITIHDLAFLLYPDILTADSRRYYNDQIEAAVLRADAILAVSEATKSDVIDMLKVDPGMIFVTPEAADAVFQPIEREVLQRYLAAHNLPDEYILFVGTFEPRKNLGGLLRAYAELRAEMRNAPPLIVAGRRGWLFQDMFVLAEQLRLGKSIIWLENPPDGDLPSLYSAASVFCLPSHYEGFGLPALEAMSCGTPVVVSERGSLPEVVGDAAVLVKPDDPLDIAAGLHKVLSNSKLSAGLRQRGLMRAQAFTWRKTAELTLAVYHRVLGY